MVYFFLILWIDREVLLLVLPGLTGAAAGSGNSSKAGTSKRVLLNWQLVLAVGWRTLVLFHLISHPPGGPPGLPPNMAMLEFQEGKSGSCKAS